MVTVCPIVIVDGLRKGGIVSYSGVSLMVNRISCFGAL